MKINIVVILFCIISFSAHAQDIEYARKHVSVLCSPDFHGRGYVKEGDKKAAEYISSELGKLGVKYQKKYPND